MRMHLNIEDIENKNKKLLELKKKVDNLTMLISKQTQTINLNFQLIMEINPIIKNYVNNLLVDKNLKNLFTNGSINDIEEYLDKFTEMIKGDTMKQLSLLNKKSKKNTNKKVSKSKKSLTGGFSKNDREAIKRSLPSLTLLTLLLMLINGILYNDYHPLPEQPLSPIFAFIAGIIAILSSSKYEPPTKEESYWKKILEDRNNSNNSMDGHFYDEGT